MASALTPALDIQLLSDHHETWSKGQPLWLVILTKFRDYSSKIVDFLLVVKFLDIPVFYESVSTYSEHFVHFTGKLFSEAMIFKESILTFLLIFLKSFKKAMSKLFF